MSDDERHVRTGDVFMTIHELDMFVTTRAGRCDDIDFLWLTGPWAGRKMHREALLNDDQLVCSIPNFRTNESLCDSPLGKPKGQLVCRISEQ